MSKTIVRKVSKVEYYLEGGDLLTPMRDDPERESLRMEVLSMKERFNEAMANRPDSLEPLEESEVPQPEGFSRNCVQCSYGKMVNFHVIEHWQAPGRPSCPDECGVRLNCETVVENGKVKKDIVECWEYWNVGPNVEI